MSNPTCPYCYDEYDVVNDSSYPDDPKWWSVDDPFDVKCDSCNRIFEICPYQTIDWESQSKENDYQ
jgi:hypothetical protein